MSDLPPGFEVVARPHVARGAGDLPPGFEVVQPSAGKPMGMLERIGDMFTGASRTEFPNAREFGPASMENTPEQIQRGQEVDTTAVNRSAITSNPVAQLEILKQRIPGLEARTDKFGNLMLKAPGQAEWSYLNKPGLSGRDIDELGTQVLATLPFLGSAGTGGNLATRAVTGAVMTAGAETEKNLLAKAQGSTQNIDPRTLATDMALGGALAPGVPSAIAQQVTRVATNNPIANTLRGAIAPHREAERRMAEGFMDTMAGQGGQRLTPEHLQNVAANQLMVRDAAEDAINGGSAALMDVMGERGRALVRSASNVSPEARDTLNNVLQPRFETQGDRISGFIERLAGGNQAQASRDALERAAREARRPFYETAFNDGRAGIVNTPELRSLQAAPAVQTAMRDALETIQNREAAGRLHTAAIGSNGAYTLEFWDEVKRNLQGLSRGMRDTNPSNAGHIEGITRRLIDQLDAQVPSYSQARGVAAGLFRANDALEAGQNFARKVVSPVEAERGLQQMSRIERDLFAQGFVEEELRRISQAGDRRNLGNLILNSPDARQRWEAALGPNRMRELDAMLHNERLMHLAMTAASGNSTTARQLVELGLAGGTGALISGFDPTNPAGWMAAILTKYGAGRAGQAIDQRVARQVANMLTSRDPSVMRRGAQIAAANGPIMRALRTADEALSGRGLIPRNIAVEAATP